VPDNCSRPTAIAKKVCSDSTRSEQVKVSVCRTNFGGCSSNGTLFSARKIFVLEHFWLAVGHILIQSVSLVFGPKSRFKT